MWKSSGDIIFKWTMSMQFIQVFKTFYGLTVTKSIIDIRLR